MASKFGKKRSSEAFFEPKIAENREKSIEKMAGNHCFYLFFLFFGRFFITNESKINRKTIEKPKPPKKEHKNRSKKKKKIPPFFKKKQNLEKNDF
jgi:hypothetical protein